MIYCRLMVPVANSEPLWLLRAGLMRDNALSASVIVVVVMLRLANNECGERAALAVIDQILAARIN